MLQRNGTERSVPLAILKIGKELVVTRASATGTLSSTYTYDSEGRMTAVQYPGYGPSNAPSAGPNLGWARDTMGRLNTMTDIAAQASIVSATTYGPSNELLSITGQISEARTYNAMLQLTSLVSGSGPNVVSVTYNYSSTQNNGKATSQTDNVSGEQVVYAYDALNRLASAMATSGSWGQSYGYDCFGNLTDQNVTAGSAPAYQVVPDPTTNHLGSVDANGNTLGRWTRTRAHDLLGLLRRGESVHGHGRGRRRGSRQLSILLCPRQQASMARRFREQRHRDDPDRRRGDLLGRHRPEAG